MMEPDVAEILHRYSGSGRDALIPLLQEIQEAHGYLSPEALKLISAELDLPVAKIYGVATFYNQFRFQPQGRYHVQICRGTACHVKGSAQLLETLQQELNVAPGQTSRDGMFSLEVVACIGACGLAPVMCVNGEFHAKLTTEKVREVIREYRRRERGKDKHE